MANAASRAVLGSKLSRQPAIPMVIVQVVCST